VARAWRDPADGNI